MLAYISRFFEDAIAYGLFQSFEVLMEEPLVFD